VKNNYCDLPEAEIRQLPERYRGFMLSPLHLNLRDGYVWVPEDTFKDMVDIVVEAAKAAALETSPEWIDAADMPAKPMGWYWAAYPGGWEFYKPQRNATLGVDHGHAGWQPLMSARYWGPFSPPGVDERKAPQIRGA
jgi:hypothetical protein